MNFYLNLLVTESCIWVHIWLYGAVTVVYSAVELKLRASTCSTCTAFIYLCFGHSFILIFLHNNEKEIVLIRRYVCLVMVARLKVKLLLLHSATKQEVMSHV